MESEQPSTSSQLNDSFSDVCYSQLNTSYISLSPPPEVSELERAFSYLIYDEDKEERTERGINKFAAVTWIGQTCDPTSRQQNHKQDKRLEGKAKMIIVNAYKGIDAIQKSLEDEFAAYRLVKGNRSIFTNMHPKADAGTIKYIKQSAKAYLAANSAKQKIMLKNMIEAIRKGEPWTNEKIHACTKCKQKFVSKPQLDEHIKKIHQNLEFPCGHCKYVAYRQTDLTLHLKLHQNKKPFPCTFVGCGKTFPNQSNLNRHTKSHSTERQRYVCEVPRCFGNKNKGPKDYADRTKLKRHMVDDHQLDEKDVDEALDVRCQRKRRSADDSDPKEVVVVEKK